jgi:hypothetical protein
VSLDFPYYEALRRAKHPAAVWWRVGDTLYYLGLLSAVAAVPAVMWGLRKGEIGLGWSAHWAALAVFGGGVVMFGIGNFAKGRAHAMGERDGISHGDSI